MTLLSLLSLLDFIQGEMLITLARVKGSEWVWGGVIDQRDEIKLELKENNCPVPRGIDRAFQYGVTIFIGSGDQVMLLL